MHGRHAQKPYRISYLYHKEKLDFRKAVSILHLLLCFAVLLFFAPLGTVRSGEAKNPGPPPGQAQ
eukprot:3307807-Prorocentrum_lima.AAC.1